MNNTFTMLVGLPGAGKSTYANMFRSSIVISSDEVRKEFGYQPGHVSGDLFNEINRRIKRGLEDGQHVIYDATNLQRRHRVALLDYLKNSPGQKNCLMYDVPIETCWFRNMGRDKSQIVPLKDFMRLLKSFQVPMTYEGWDGVYLVNDDDKSYHIDKFLIPTIGFQQDNSHHSLCLYDHLKKVRKLVNEKMSEHDDVDISGLLPTAALYHDIGKLFTKDFHDSNGNPSEEAHYYNHENIGAYMFLAYTDDTFGLQWDRLEIAALINWHMRPYITMNETKKQRERDMLGEEFCAMLDILHEADEEAK